MIRLLSCSVASAATLAVLAALLVLPPAARAQTLFDRMDANHDGDIQPAEFQAAWPDAADGTFGQLDADGDGVLSHAEWADGRQLLGLGRGLGQGGTCQGGGRGCGQGAGQGKGKGLGPGAGAAQ